MRYTAYFFSLAQLLILLLGLFTNWYDQLVYAINILAVLMVLDKLGKGIVLREIIALHSCVICLLMPLIGYLVYNTTNHLALITFRYMPVSKEMYFDFALPAVTAFSLFLCWPIASEKASDQGMVLQKRVDQIKDILKGNHRIGIFLMATGIVITTFVNSLPASLQFVFNLFYFSAFAGCLYVFFAAPFRFKKIILIGFALFILAAALRNGMFTIIAYMGMAIFSFLFIGKRLALWKKVLYFAAGVFLLTLIQSVKPAYRKMLKNDYEANKTVIFTDLVTERLTNLEKFVSPEAFFPLHYRGNQGFNVACVMKRFPAQVPFDNGSRLMVAIASSFVPRVLWPDKPEAGGVANMKYYAGITIMGWSTNVGPLGEAYASFGVSGGIIFMCCLGLFIRFSYKRVFIIAKKMPLLILWIPVLFYQITYSAENDTLQIFNSLLKTAFFILLLYKLKPEIFRPSKKVAESLTPDSSLTVKQIQPS